MNRFPLPALAFIATVRLAAVEQVRERMRCRCPECGGCVAMRKPGILCATLNPCTCPGSIPGSRKVTGVTWGGPKLDERKPIPFASQIADIAPFIGQSVREIVPADIDSEEVSRRAVERFAGIGAREHGDSLFGKSNAELLEDEIDEYSDAVVYRARRLARTFDRTLGYDGNQRAEALPIQEDAS